MKLDNFLIKDLSMERELAGEGIGKINDLPIWKLDKITVGKGKGLIKSDQFTF